MKRCTKCGCEKPKSDFNFLAKSKDNLTYHCRDCRNATARRQHAQRTGKLLEEAKPSGTNPWDWRTYRSQINWIDNNRYVPTDVSSKHYRHYQL